MFLIHLILITFDIIKYTHKACVRVTNISNALHFLSFSNVFRKVSCKCVKTTVSPSTGFPLSCPMSGPEAPTSHLSAATAFYEGAACTPGSSFRQCLPQSQGLNSRAQTSIASAIHAPCKQGVRLE